jgi:hypothetical protein
MVTRGIHWRDDLHHRRLLHTKEAIMRVVHLKVIIAADPDTAADDGLDNKVISLDDVLWTLPQHMYPRDIRLLAELQLLIDKYNGRVK